MAKNTKKELRNQVIYSVFVRNHTEEGTFKALEKDLNRIKSLGTDVIWLLPIHPIGEKNRKGKQGSPYAIQNYREVNPEYGTKEDFVDLVDAIHNKGMKCIIDVVYHHTSPDSWLAEQHPEFFYRKNDGNMGNKVGDWDDVVDLDYENKDLWNYQIETLCMWAEIVDGFRCDVASMVPVDFWIQAREAVERVRPGCIWLAESVYPGFVKELRDQGFIALSDSEVYQAFDITYDYDIEDLKNAYLQGKKTISDYIHPLNMQDCIYPDNYVKLRFIENHDQDRAKNKIRNESDLINWTAFTYFQKGTTLIYAGQEVQEDHAPSLFDTDKVNWKKGKDISQLLKCLYSIKGKEIMAEGNYSLEASPHSDTVVGTYQKDGRSLIGVFSLTSQFSNAKVVVPDGTYTNLIDNQPVVVSAGSVLSQGRPIIFEV